MRNAPRREPIRSTQSQASNFLTSQLGTAAFLIMRSAEYRVLRIASIGAWLQPPILLKQICFFYDTLGHPVGYLTWAYLSDEVEEKFVTDPDFLLHFSEWNEGDRLWLIDFLAPAGMVREIVGYIRRNLFSEFSQVRYVRRDANGAIRKVCTWPLANDRGAGGIT